MDTNESNLDEKKLEAIFHSNYASLFVLGFKMSKDRSLTKDLIQSLFMELWEKRTQLKQVEHWNAYLRKSLYRKMIAALQQQKKQLTFLNNPTPNTPLYTPSYENLLIESQIEITRHHQLQSALQQLPEQERKVLELRFFKDLTYDEIASNTGKSKQTVYNQVFSAISKLRKMLKY